MNILYFPTKLDGSQPRKKRKDKVFFYPDTGVIGEQGGEITHINNLTKLPTDKYFYNFNTLKKNKTFIPRTNITRINNLTFISQMVFSKYFKRIRKIYNTDYSTLHTKVKYEKRTGNHHLYFALDDGAGYQRIVLDSKYRKLKGLKMLFACNLLSITKQNPFTHSYYCLRSSPLDFIRFSVLLVQQPYTLTVVPLLFRTMISTFKNEKDTHT